MFEAFQSPVLEFIKAQNSMKTKNVIKDKTCHNKAKRTRMISSMCLAVAVVGIFILCVYSSHLTFTLFNTALSVRKTPNIINPMQTFD